MVFFGSEFQGQHSYAYSRLLKSQIPVQYPDVGFFRSLKLFGSISTYEKIFWGTRAIFQADDNIAAGLVLSVHKRTTTFKVDWVKKSNSVGP